MNSDNKTSETMSACYNKRKSVKSVWILAFIMAAFMFILPAAAIVSDTGIADESYAVGGETAAVSINGQEFDTLSEAVTQASPGAEILFLKDITLDNAISIDKNLTLNLNQKKLTAAPDLGQLSVDPVTCEMFVLTGDTNVLTVKNGSLYSATTGNYAVNQNHAMFCIQGGDLILDSVNTSSYIGVISVGYGSDITLRNCLMNSLTPETCPAHDHCCNVIREYYLSSAVDPGSTGYGADTKFTVTVSGSFDGTKTLWHCAEKDSTVNTALTVEDGSHIAARALPKVLTVNGDLTVTSSDVKYNMIEGRESKGIYFLNGGNASVDFVDVGFKAMPEELPTVKNQVNDILFWFGNGMRAGGTIDTGEYAVPFTLEGVFAVDPSLIITGPSELSVTDAGFGFSKSGNVYELQPEAKIGTVGYPTLADAVVASKSGDVLVLQKNATLASAIEIPHDLKIDLNGLTLTSDDSTLPVKLNKVSMDMFHVADSVNFTVMNGKLVSAISAPYDYGTLKEHAFIGGMVNGSLTMTGVDTESYIGVISVGYGAAVVIENCVMNAQTGFADFPAHGHCCNVIREDYLSTAQDPGSIGYGEDTVFTVLLKGTYDGSKAFWHCAEKVSKQVTGNTCLTIDSGATVAAHALPQVFTANGTLNLSSVDYNVIEGREAKGITVLGTDAIISFDDVKVNDADKSLLTSFSITFPAGAKVSGSIESVSVNLPFAVNGDFVLNAPFTLSGAESAVSDNVVYTPAPSGYKAYGFIVKADAEARIGDVYYLTLEDAVGDADTGDEIVVLKDVSLTPVEGTPGEINAVMNLSNSVTLNLNSKRITWDADAKTQNFESVPVMLSIGEGTVTITGNGVMDADLGADNSSYCINLYLYSFSAPVLNILNGTFTGSPTAIQVQKGTLNIADGTFGLTESASAFDPKYIINCIDESFKDKSAVISVTGGTFGFDPSADPEGPGTTYLADTVFSYKSGSDYKVMPKADAEARIGEVYYESLLTALASAEPGSTVVLVNDVVLDGQRIDCSKSIILDGANHSITVNSLPSSTDPNKQNKRALWFTGDSTEIRDLTVNGVGNYVLAFNGGAGIINGITLTDVTVTGASGTAIDFNGCKNVVLNNVTVLVAAGQTKSAVLDNVDGFTCTGCSLDIVSLHNFWGPIKNVDLSGNIADSIIAEDRTIPGYDNEGNQTVIPDTEDWSIFSGAGVVVPREGTIVLPAGFVGTVSEPATRAYKVEFTADVAMVDSEKYPTLEAAFNAAAPGKTVKLLQDVVLTKAIDVSKNLTLDLAGHSITVEDIAEPIVLGEVTIEMFKVGEGVSFTVQNGELISVHTPPYDYSVLKNHALIGGIVKGQLTMSGVTTSSYIGVISVGYNADVVIENCVMNAHAGDAEFPARNHCCNVIREDYLSTAVDPGQSGYGKETVFSVVIKGTYDGKKAFWHCAEKIDDRITGNTCLDIEDGAVVAAHALPQVFGVTGTLNISSELYNTIEGREAADMRILGNGITVVFDGVIVNDASTGRMTAVSLTMPDTATISGSIDSVTKALPFTLNGGFAVAGDMNLSGALSVATDNTAYLPVCKAPGVFKFVPAADAEASVDGVAYETFDEALAAAENKTIVLLKDINKDIVLSFDVTIDLNGKKITNAVGHTITVSQGANVVITGEGTVDNITHARAAVFNQGSLVINGGTYDRSLEAGTNVPNNANGNSYYTILNQGVMEINAGVVVNNNGSFSSIIDNGWYSGGAAGMSATLTINGGEFNGGKYLKNDTCGDLIINNGVFYGNYMPILNWNTATINGGEFTFCDESVILNCSGDAQIEKGQLVITGGKFTAKNGSPCIVLEGGTAQVSGGQFNDRTVGQYAEGKLLQPIEDGFYQVADAALFAAKVGHVGYNVLADAVADATASALPVELLKSIESGSFVIDGTVTVNGNGNVIVGGLKLNAKGAGSYDVVLNNIKFDGASSAKWAIIGENQTTDDIRTVNLTVTGCTFTNYLEKCIYLTNVENLAVTGCTFDFDFGADVTYGDYALDLNLIGVQNAAIDISGNTFTGKVKNGPVKVTQRGDSLTTDDVENGFANHASSVIATAVFNDNVFTDTVAGKGHIVIGSSPGTEMRTYNVGFSVEVTSFGETIVCYRGSPTDEAAPFKVLLSDNGVLLADGSVYDDAGVMKGKAEITTDGQIAGNIPACISVPCDVSYDMAGHGDQVPPEVVQYGQLLTEPQAPSAQGFRFMGWYADAGYLTEYDFSAPVTADITLYAKWAEIFDVTVETSVQENVSVDPASGIAGETVTVQVTEPAGKELISLTYSTAGGEAVPISGGSFVLPEADVTVSASFAFIDYAVTVGEITGGTVTVQVQSAHFGDQVTVQAVPDTGKELATLTFTVNGDTSPIEGLTFTMPAGDVVINATFSDVVYNVSVDPSVAEYVSVTPTSGIMGAEIQVTVNLPAGKSLKSLTFTVNGDTSPIEDSRFLMPAGDVLVNAVFEDIVYDVTVDPSVAEYVSADPASGIMGAEIQVTVNVPAGKSLKSLTFTVNGDTSPIEESRFLMPAGDVLVNAVFEDIVYNVTVDPAVADSVSVTPATGIMGAEIQVTVNVPAGKSLKSLTYAVEGQEPVDIVNKVFEMPAADVTVSAEFEDVVYSVSVDGSVSQFVSVSPTSGIMGAEIQVTVNVPAGKALKSLTYAVEGQEPVDIVNKVFQLPAGNVTVSAEFEDVVYSVSVNESVAEFITVDPAGGIMGTEIQVTVDLPLGKSLKTLTYTTGGGEPVTIVNGKFLMPAGDVAIDATFGDVVYSVTVDELVTQFVSVDPASGIMGTEIQVTVNAPVGKELKSLTYTVASAEPVEIVDGKFNMPAANVLINADFADVIYNVTVDTSVEQFVSVTPASGAMDTEISVSVAVPAGKSLKTLTYTAGEGAPVDIVDGRFLMPADNVLVKATFEDVVYSVTVDESVSQFVSVSPATGVMGTKIQVTVTEPVGKKLSSLSYRVGEGEPVAITDSSFDMPAGNAVVSAVFEDILYAVTIGTMDGGTVTASVEKAKFGDTVELTVEPNNGMKLGSLSYFANGVTTPITGTSFEMPAGNAVVNAEFVAEVYTVSVDPSVKDSVSVQPAEAMMGAIVKVTVTEPVGKALDKLTYTVAGSDPVAISGKEFLMPAADVTVNATFRFVDYNVSVGEVSGGTVTASVPAAHYGDVISVNVVPDTGMKLKKLTYLANGAVTEIKDLQFTMPAGNTVINAEFDKISYSVTVGSSQGGTVTLSAANAYYGDTVTVNVVPDAGKELTSLTYTAPSADSVIIVDFKFTMPASSVVVDAVFDSIVYTVTIDESVKGIVTAEPSEGVMGTEISLNVDVPAGKQIKSVTYKAGEADPVPVEDLRFAMPASDVTVSAEFEDIQYTVSVDGPSASFVSAEPDSASAGTVITVTVDVPAGKKVNSLTYTDDAGKTSSISDGRFTMPASNVLIKAVLGDVVYKAMADTSLKGGSVAVTPDSGIMGTLVKVTVTVNDGMKLDSVFYKLDGKKVQLDINDPEFLMPASDVTVSAVISKVTEVVIDTDDEGTVSEEAVETITEDIEKIKEADPEAVPEVSIDSSSNTSAVLPEKLVETVVSNEAVINVTTSDGTVSLSSKALSTLELPADSKVSVSVQKSAAPASHEEFVKDSPVYEVYLDVDGEKFTENFGEPVTVSVQYTLRDGESAKGLFVYWLSEDGSITKITDVTYEDGTLSFETPHFSMYTIKYEEAPDGVMLFVLLFAVIVGAGVITHFMKKMGH